MECSLCWGKDNTSEESELANALGLRFYPPERICGEVDGQGNIYLARFHAQTCSRMEKISHAKISCRAIGAVATAGSGLPMW